MHCCSAHTGIGAMQATTRGLAAAQVLVPARCGSSQGAAWSQMQSRLGASGWASSGARQRSIDCARLFLAGAPVMQCGRGHQGKRCCRQAHSGCATMVTGVVPCGVQAGGLPREGFARGGGLDASCPRLPLGLL